ncbi:uncharacterized protein TNCV_3242221 [Trichonephila clavipes]|nr:uncharacterized protein TNCV_3242221 [Trichonephila clavipes]
MIVITAEIESAHAMGTVIQNVMQPGAFVWFEKTQGSEGATCVWKVADAVGCTRAFLKMWWSSRRLVCRECLDPGLRVNDISRIHWSQYFLTTQSKRLN